jgi:4'-phosphopantetheinyl transferase
VPGVHVWRASLDRPAAEVAALHELLDTAERSRAARFRHDRDRRRFIVARATLRIFLSDYTQTAPHRVPLRILPGGKPTLDRECEPIAPHFNVSHCGELALFALADREVGIDVERLACHDDMHRVAAHFFSPEELLAFQRLNGAEQRYFYFRTWVRKEAYLKAAGSGLAIDPASVSVANGYEVHDLADIHGHVAAIALALSPEPRMRLKERSAVCSVSSEVSLPTDLLSAWEPH